MSRIIQFYKLPYLICFYHRLLALKWSIFKNPTKACLTLHLQPSSKVLNFSYELTPTQHFKWNLAFEKV